MALLCFFCLLRTVPRRWTALWAHPSLLETAVLQEHYSVESQQVQHTARPQKLLSDSLSSNSCTNLYKYSLQCVLNTLTHKILSGLFLKWSTSSAGENSFWAKKTRVLLFGEWWKAKQNCVQLLIEQSFLAGSRTDFSNSFRGWQPEEWEILGSTCLWAVVP